MGNAPKIRRLIKSLSYQITVAKVNARIMYDGAINIVFALRA